MTRPADKAGPTRPDGRRRPNRPYDLTGAEFGELIVLEEIDVVNNRRLWRCLCRACGTVLPRSTSKLRDGAVSCGCARRWVAPLEGGIFGSLTADHYVGTRARQALWHCLCDCKGAGKGPGWKIVPAAALKSGQTTSCGCRKHLGHRRIDRTGERHGHLLVIGLAPRDDKGRLRWLVRCECGVEKPLLANYLGAKGTQSCGCLRTRRRRVIDRSWIGRVVGRLTVKAFARETKTLVYWTCLCECGRTTTVTQNALQQKKTQSCGCLHRERTVEVNRARPRPRGKDSPRYRHDLTDEERKAWTTRCPGAVAWRNRIVETAAGHCTLCGVADALQAHHLLGVSDWPELELELDNGTALCRECHVGFHVEFGQKSFDMVDWLEYRRERLRELHGRVPSARDEAAALDVSRRMIRRVRARLTPVVR